MHASKTCCKKQMQIVCRICVCVFLRHIACGENMKVRRVAVHVYRLYFYLNYCAPYNVRHSHYFELGKGNFLLFFGGGGGGGGAIANTKQ